MTKHFNKLLPDWLHQKVLDQVESSSIDWHFPGNGIDLNLSCFMRKVYDAEQNYLNYNNLDSLNFALECWINENQWFNFKSLNRCIVNFYTPNMTMGWHTDHSNPNFYTLIYYVNDSDGGTQVEDNIYDHKENSGILLNSNVNHINIESQSPRRISIAWILEGYPNESI